MRFLLLLMILLSLTGIGSCTPSVSEICHSRLPEFQKSLDASIDNLKMKFPKRSSRRLASASPKAEPLSNDDQKRWQKWAEGNLKDVQRFADAARNEPSWKPIRAELNSVAILLVHFDGYTIKGKTEKMISSLQSMRESVEKVQDFACKAP